LAPSLDGGDDLIGVGGPDEGLGMMIGHKRSFGSTRFLLA